MVKIKIYFEFYENKNIKPFTIDIFVDIKSVTKIKILNVMKKNRIEYLILDSYEQINLSIDCLKSADSILANDTERNYYIVFAERLGRHSSLLWNVLAQQSVKVLIANSLPTSK